MRKTILMLFMFTASVMSFVSCSSDDSDSSSSSNIVGKWQHEKAGGILGGEEILLPYEHDCPTKKDYIEFLSNGTGRSYYYDQNCQLEEGGEGGTWDKSGNILTLSGEDGTNEFEILTLNNTTLKIKELNGQGFILEFKRI